MPMGHRKVPSGTSDNNVTVSADSLGDNEGLPQSNEADATEEKRVAKIK